MPDTQLAKRNFARIVIRTNYIDGLKLTFQVLWSTNILYEQCSHQATSHKPFRCVGPIIITVARDPGNAFGYFPPYQHPIDIVFASVEHALSPSSQLLGLPVSWHQSPQACPLHHWLG